jgi:cytidine deaminase
MRALRKERFEKALKGFPPSARSLLRDLPRQGGMLTPDAWRELMRLLGVSVEALMIDLLPLAKVFSAAPISNFHVGAVALASKQSADTRMSLCLGANMEFNNLALNTTLHAEQAAVMNAWHRDTGRLRAIAVSDTPCGHCRQFLGEVGHPDDLMILTPTGKGPASRGRRLAELLPAAFTPADLGIDGGFMAPSPAPGHLSLARESDDEAVLAALSAAEASHAPYTGNLAGCAIRTADEGVVSGRYVESAAYNPSVSPFHAAVLRLNLMTLKQTHAIQRVVLVEKPTRIRQKDLVKMLSKTRAPGIELEYHIAREGGG